jgi:hypothetical protein
MIVTVVACDKDCRRVEMNDVVVGFALRMADNSWRPYKSDMETRIESPSFKTPKGAANAIARYAGA